MSDLVERGTRIARHMVSIADASQRADGADIPLGEQCREAADVVLSQAARIQAIETSLAEAEDRLDHAVQCHEALMTEQRRQVLEEAEKVADTTMRREVTGLKLDSSYRAGVRWAGERIKDAIRALASDEVKP